MGTCFFREQMAKEEVLIKEVTTYVRNATAIPCLNASSEKFNIS